MNKKEYLEKIRQHCEKLVARFADDKKEKAEMACRAFTEYVERLGNRHNELRQIEEFKTNADPDEMAKHEITLTDLQLGFVDKTEAFHQQVYATISAFIMLLSHVAGQKFLSQMPIDSLTKFLRHISDKSYESIVKDQATLLIKSADFRSKFIDHPQQHALHDWLTYSYGTGTCIIYFIRKGNEVYYREPKDPYAPDFTPPVNYKSFYVSPAHTQVFLAVIYFTEKVLSSLAHEKEEKPSIQEKEIMEKLYITNTD